MRPEFTTLVDNDKIKVHVWGIDDDPPKRIVTYSTQRVSAAQELKDAVMFSVHHGSPILSGSNVSLFIRSRKKYSGYWEALKWSIPLMAHVCLDIQILRNGQTAPEIRDIASSPDSVRYHVYNSTSKKDTVRGYKTYLKTTYVLQATRR